ncbi:MAG: hypothetical protein F6K14_23150 [Symploca sp. SIO2C1]|nr:hypothetical protein [Symploca sp. SIO2C1]
MSLHLTLSTLSKVAERPWDWQKAAMSVDFLYEGRSGSIGELTAEIGNHFSNDIQSLTVVEPKLSKHSGRYRYKRTVPI